MKFKINDIVHKNSGYRYPGVIVSAFFTLSGKERYVVELVSISGDGVGMLHIFSDTQLELLDKQSEQYKYIKNIVANK